jgi:hypothetical protein
VLADLAVLQQARRRAAHAEDEAADEAAAAAGAAAATEWRPPQGQKGDGRSSLNDKLGY